MFLSNITYFNYFKIEIHLKTLLDKFLKQDSSKLENQLIKICDNSSIKKILIDTSISTIYLRLAKFLTNSISRYDKYTDTKLKCVRDLFDRLYEVFVNLFSNFIKS